MAETREGSLIEQTGSAPRDESRESLELVRHLYLNGPIPILANIVSSSVLAAMVWDDVDAIIWGYWLGAQVMLASVRMGLVLAFKRDERKRTPSWWGGWFAVGALCSGCLWGLLPLFAMQTGSTFNVLSIMLVMYGMISGSVASNSAVYPAYLGYAVPAGGGLVFRLAMEGGDYGYLSGLMAVFLLVNLAFAWNHRSLVRSVIRKRLDNERLLKVLDERRRQAEKASRDKSRFLASVSHDLRQPLHALDLFHGSLAGRLSSEDQRELLELARRSSRSLAEMLGELMDVARLDAGKVEARLERLRLAPLMRECVEELRPLAVGKELSLHLRIPRGVCVETDPVLLKRILRNLLANAIQHTDTGGVLVGARRRGSTVRIEVHDTGPGIDEESLGKVFDEFYQVRNPERDREKGLGLGLAIVRRLAGLLGCEVEARSRFGRGSCFAVTMPVCESLMPCEETDVVGDDASLAGLFVVVVDDDRAILEGMRRRLRDWGCEVLLAEGGRALMEELGSHAYLQPDWVICDYRLRDGETGLDVVAAVRRHFGASLPAAIVSGDVHPDVRRAAEAAGCVFVEKPVEEGRLRGLLASAGD